MYYIVLLINHANCQDAACDFVIRYRRVVMVVCPTNLSYIDTAFNSYFRYSSLSNVALQRKLRDYYGSGWVGPGLTRIFFGGKSSQNSHKPVLIFWSSIPCLYIAKSCWLL